MRIAALYDIHGNLPALEAVLSQVELAGVDLVFVGGDISPGPMVRETLELLFSLDKPVQVIRGNGENDALAELNGTPAARVPEQYRDIVSWSAKQITADQAAKIPAWPSTAVYSMQEHGDVLFCHATPDDDNEIFTRLTPQERLTRIFRDCSADIVVCGHTHMQFDIAVEGVRVINAGSVGMPFGRAGADWLLLDGGVEFRHTDYDLEEAVSRIRETGYPQALEFARSYVLDPPSAEQMLEVYRRADDVA